MTKIDNSSVLITGGTGSLGTALVERLLSGNDGIPKRIAIFSRDELKQAQMKAAYPDDRLDFQLGDIRNEKRVEEVLQGIDIVFHAAAMKRVEMCEQHPQEAVATNIHGTENIISAIQRYRLPVCTVVGVSSDKGCSPINVYGATKFIQEKLILHGNIICPNTRFVCVCYGNVMASRGSMIPMFQQQIASGGPVTVRDPNMTRFLISLDEAVDTLLDALNNAQRGEVYVPQLPAAKVVDVVEVLMNGQKIPIRYTGRNPGEKIHETLITEAEASNVVVRDGYMVVTPHRQDKPVLHGEYVSSGWVVPVDALRKAFIERGYITEKVEV